MNRFWQHKKLRRVTLAVLVILVALASTLYTLNLRSVVRVGDGIISFNLSENPVSQRVARAAIEVTSLGCLANKANSINIDISEDGVEVGDVLIACVSADIRPDTGVTTKNSSAVPIETFTRHVEGDNAGEAVAGIYYLKVTDITDLDRVNVTHMADSIAIGISVYLVTGLDDSPLDIYNSATGSGTDASVSLGSVLSQDDEVVFCSTAVEDEIDDSHGTWTTGSGYVSGNEQFDATNGQGDASNMQVHSVARVVTDGTSTTYQGVDAGHDSSDWAAAIVAYKMDTGGTPSLQNTPSSKDFGTVAKNASYWSSGSEPSWPLTDGDAYFTITNDGSIDIDIDISSTDFNGGGGWNLVTGSPGSGEARMLAYKEGDGSGDNITILNTQVSFITSLGATNDIDWEFRLDVPTVSDQYQHSANITLEASAA